jgi:hypothetical protein
MKTIKTIVAAIAAAIMLCLPSAALARGGFGVSFGYSNFRGYHHPHHFGHSMYYGIGYHYWARPWPSYVWVEDYYPTVFVERPVVVERPSVIVREKVIVEKAPEKGKESTATYDEKAQKVFAELTNRKKELLKRLKLGDSGERMNAIGKLAGFSFDAKVRKAIEDVLLTDPDPQLRIEAARAFARARNKDSLAALEKARVEDSDKDVRMEADKAIKEINAE